MPRARGSKNRRTIERETAKKIAAARAELVKNAPPLDFSMPLDSLDIMECPPSALVGQIRQIEEGSVSGSS